MLDARSALAEHLVPGRYGAGEGGVSLSERRGRSIVQVAGWPERFDAVTRRITELTSCPVDPTFGRAGVGNGLAAIRVGAERIWMVGEEANLVDRLREGLDGDAASLLDLGHSRTILRIDGPASGRVLAKGLPIDLHANEFPVDATAATALHGTGVLVHRCGAAAFNLYIPRGFAVSIWQWLTSAAAEFGYQTGE